MRTFSRAFLKAGHQLVDNVLHDSVQLEVEQGLRLVDFDVAHGTVLAGLKVLDDTTLADWKGNTEENVFFFFFF